MHYEVFIPSNSSSGYDTTLTVEAENWMSALKMGLTRCGEAPEIIRNVMCDIQADNTINVTDAATRRVFRLKELDGEVDDVPPVPEPGNIPLPEPPSTLGDAETLIMEAVPPSMLPNSKASDEWPVVAPTTPMKQPGKGDLTRSGTAPGGTSSSHIGSRKLARKSAAERAASKVVAVKRTKTGELRAVERTRIDEFQQVAETAIEDVFLEIYDIFDREMDLEHAVNYVLDLAIDKMEAQTGSVLFAVPDGTELYVASTRAPNRDEVLSIRVPMGHGIAGFCTREGVSLAVSDGQNDPRFVNDISQEVGVKTTCVLCTPVQFQGRVYGCIELINKKGRSDFAPSEVNVLGYIGHQLGKFVQQMLAAQE